MLNIDSLLKHIYERLCSALRDGVSLQSLFDYLKNYSGKFFRKKKKKGYATSPTINSTPKKYRSKKYQKIAYPKAYALIRGDAEGRRDQRALNVIK